MNNVPLFKRCLGEKFEILPPAIQLAHEVDNALILEGMADIKGPDSLLYRLLRKVMGFPDPATNVPVKVVITQKGASEHWARRFGRHRYVSTLSCPAQGDLIERFGPLRFLFAIDVNARQLDMIFKGWSFIIIPLPGFLAPKITAFEHVDDKGRFCFDVDMALPLLGQLVHYRGWLVPAVETVDQSV